MRPQPPSRPRAAVPLILLSMAFLGPAPGADAGVAAAPAKRLLAIDDFDRFEALEDLQCSPDGRWVAYTVTRSDREADSRRSAVWMVDWEGTQDLRLTYGPDSDTSPRWSPDGRYLAFLSARPAEGPAQVWRLDRRGGEARRLTDVKREIVDYEWSPDGKRLVLVARERDDPKAPPKPIVIDRYAFKEDVQGYLTPASLRHLYLFDVDTGKTEPLTSDTRYDDRAPVWSPDGTRIAYISNHAPEPDQSGTNDIFLVDARPGSTPVKLLTAWAPNDQHLLWSPDGRWIAYLLGAPPRDYAYGQDKLAVVPAAGGAPRVLTETLDLMASAPAFSPDGASLTFMVADDRVQYPARVAVSGGAVERVVKDRVVVTEQCVGGGHTAVLASTDASAPEVQALEGSTLRKLTEHNDPLLSQIRLGAVEDVAFRSKDGTDIHGMMVVPPSFEAGTRYPTVVWIHGGPNMQDDHSLPVDTYALQLERQLLAAHGYVVLAVNYRGSSGRGSEFSRSIFADWGDKEVADLLAGVDDAIRRGVADPACLGIGGWSYGGILTDYTIATDTRFKAAVSGAGSADQLAMYGSDQYILEYDNELGPPWRNLETWLKVSYPFFHADRIRTPTLFMGGEKDFNVPVAGSEQMYQALRGLGVPTRLVVYPGQFHILTRPSFIRDRLERWLAWFDRYLKPAE
jgi:dipeptidyl aminopeptidase/acylaminoacyl peptidase